MYLTEKLSDERSRSALTKNSTSWAIGILILKGTRFHLSWTIGAWRSAYASRITCLMAFCWSLLGRPYLQTVGMFQCMMGQIATGCLRAG